MEESPGFGWGFLLRGFGFVWRWIGGEFMGSVISVY